jgi:hypothetical protein
MIAMFIQDVQSKVAKKIAKPPKVTKKKPTCSCAKKGSKKVVD